MNLSVLLRLLSVENPKFGYSEILCLYYINIAHIENMFTLLHH